jgi:mono/diheme cytochrome c family protein
MMATSADLEDFALGSSLTEGVIGAPSDISKISIERAEGGHAIAMADVADYLRAGHNKYAAAAGLMGEVVQLSTSNMTESDVRAIAVYLKSLSGATSQTDASVDQSVMTAGGAIYGDLCAACHQKDGSGVPSLFSKLSNAATIAAADPTTVLRVILQGTQTVATDREPTGPAMPGFSWLLDDEQVAAVASYVRNHFAQAPAVSADQVGKMRVGLSARTN